MYSLLNDLINDTFPNTEKLSNRLDEMEQRVLENPERDFMVSIQKAKKLLYTVRHVVWPMRKSIGQNKRRVGKA